MDIDLARTFLAVVETGSFLDAASRVFVTQSTVSMRIKTLEERLGKTLFERSKSGASLTPAGVQFHKHAAAMVRIWEQARLDVALPEGFQAALTVGGQYSLWDGFLLEWLARMRTSAPNVAFRTQLGFSNVLMQRLVEGSIDIGIMYTPQARPGFKLDLLFEEELVMVSSEARAPRKPGKNYIYIDWGPEFQADHSLNFSDLATPWLYMELGSLGLNYLLNNKATGYFPMRLVTPLIQSGQLRRVKGAPAFRYPAYVVYPDEADSAIIGMALKTLRKIAAKNDAKRLMKTEAATT